MNLRTKAKTGPANPEDHIVVAAIGGRSTKVFLGYAVVSAPMSFTAAQQLFQVKERGRALYDSHVLHYAVRSVVDPRFAPLVSLGYAPRYGGDIGAAQVWAEEYGFLGKPGGWIYRPNGEVVCHGWASLAGLLKRQNKIALGEDGRWYVLGLPLVP